MFLAATASFASSRAASGHCTGNLRKRGVSEGNLSHPEEYREVAHGRAEVAVNPEPWNMYRQ